jgi:hypothetical protein
MTVWAPPPARFHSSALAPNGHGAAAASGMREIVRIIAIMPILYTDSLLVQDLVWCFDFVWKNGNTSNRITEELLVPA